MKKNKTTKKPLSSVLEDKQPRPARKPIASPTQKTTSLPKNWDPCDFYYY